MHLAFERLSQPYEWASARAAAAAAGALWVVAGTALYRLDPATGESVCVDEGPWETRHLVAIGDALLAIERSGALYRIELGPAPSWERLDGDWEEVEAAAPLGGDAALLAWRGALFRIDGSGAAVELPTETRWSVRLLATVGAQVAVLEQSGRLWRVDARTGAHAPWDTADWSRVRAMAGLDGRLFVQEGDGFAMVHPTETLEESLPTEPGWETRMLIALPGTRRLAAFERAGSVWSLELRAGAAPADTSDEAGA